MDEIMGFNLFVLPDGLLESLQANWGTGLTDDMVVQSMHDASEFFNITDPMQIVEGWTTGVYNNNPFMTGDDVLMISRDQLESMGITEKDGLDLVLTHECAHRRLQGLPTNFDSHQEELCCDYMAGVRAGLNGIDVTQMQESLADSPESETHPAGANRVAAIEMGVDYAQNYLAEHHQAPSFSDCVEHFSNEIQGSTVYADNEQITLRPDMDDPQAFHGYSQSEINSRMDKAESDMGYWKSEIRRHMELSKHESCRETELHHARVAEGKYNDARSEYNKWKNTKPDDLKGFVNDADWHLKQSDWHAERGEYSDANDHLKSAEMCSD